MSRKVIDCRQMLTDVDCTVLMSAERDDGAPDRCTEGEGMFARPQLQ